MDWNTFFSSLFVSVGGAIGISLIILRFTKKRIENYIDDSMQHKFDKKLEEYKQNLNKQFSNYEIFTKRSYDCIEKVVNQLNEVEKCLKVMQEGIIKCSAERLTFDYIFNRNDDLHIVENLSNVSKELEQSKVTHRICLPNHIVKEIDDVLIMINEYTGGIKQEMNELRINRATCQRLLELGNEICDKVDSISKCIREESLRQSGEL